MREYQSWLQQVEDGQESLRGTNDEVADPVPEKPPGLWDRTKRALVWKIRYQTSGTRLLAPRERSMRGLPSSHGRNLKILMFGDQMLFKLYVPLPAILTLHHGEHGLLLLNYLILTTHYCPTEGHFRFQSVDSKLSIALQNIWLMLQAR